MKIAVFGKSGQVATELALLNSAHQVTCFGRAEADFLSPNGLAEVAQSIDCDAMINAAAYTAVDKAEEDEAAAMAINGQSPGRLAKIAADRDIPLVHISTDYVFDGAGTAPFAPGDATGPLGVYGTSKLAGEAAVTAAGGRFGILRTSWVFSAHGANFLKTMLRLGADRDALRIVADQVGGPTPAGAIAAACVRMAEALAEDQSKAGVYHFSGAPDASWADFARAIFDEAGLTVAVEDIPTADYPTPAKRPLNSRLDCRATAAAFGIERPDWRAAIGPILRAL